MPDIHMCPSVICPERERCYRNAASGTKPSDMRQAYFVLGQEASPSETADCNYFTPALRPREPDHPQATGASGMSDILHEIEIAAQLLAEAEKNYMNAATVASNARREETAALNNLNDKQKKIRCSNREPSGIVTGGSLERYQKARRGVCGMSMNHAILVGNVGRDPDIRTTQSGDRIANFSVATSESWKDKATSERKEAVEWHNIVIYNQSLVDIAERYVKKGSRGGVSGMIKSRKYTDKDGIERRVTDIVIGRFKGELNLLGQPQGGNRAIGQTHDLPAAPPPCADPRAAAHRLAGGDGRRPLAATVKVDCRSRTIRARWRSTMHAAGNAAQAAS